MQVSNGQVWMAREPLQELLKEPLPIKTAYWLTKLSRQVNNQIAIIDELRIKLIKQFGITNINGQVTIQPDSPNWERFASTFTELLNEVVELGAEKVILPIESDGHISGASLIALEPFVEVV